MSSATEKWEFDKAPPESKEEAREILERVQDRQQNLKEKTPTDQQQKLRRMSEEILKNLDDASQVVPELLQNADDVGGECTAATLRLTEEEFSIENHKEPMTADQVAALGEFTASTKHDLSYIGYFGIGFKTIFSITDNPRIETGHFAFQYDRDDPELPEKASGNDLPFDGTRIRLPFKSDLPETRRQALKTKLESIDRLLPFLNNLETIRVEVEGETTIYERRETQKNVHEVRERSPDSDESPDIDRYRLFTTALDTDEETFEMIAEERDFEAEDLDDRTIELTVSIAVPVDGSGRPISHSDSRLFCYFPASQTTDLPFDVQADFLLKSDRQQIRPGHPLNDRFLKAAGEILDTAITTFHAEQVAPETILELIPDPNPAQDRPAYLTPLLDHAYTQIEGQAIVPNESGDLFQPQELVILPEALRSVLPLQEFADAYADVDAHPTPVLDNDIYDRLCALDGTADLSVAETLEQLQDMAVLDDLTTPEIVEFLGAVEEYLDGDSFSRYPSSDERKEIKRIESEIQSLAIFPFQREDESSGRQALTDVGNSIYLPAQQNESAYEPFYEDLDLLSGEFVAELESARTVSESTAGRAKDLLSERLEIDSLQHSDIVRDIINEAYSEPEAHRDELLDDYLRYIKERSGTLADISDVQLRTEDGQYAPPEDLYLPSEYNKGRYDSSLVLGTLTSNAPVTPSYLDGDSNGDDVDDDIQSWREFLAELGVQDHIHVQKNPDHCDRVTFESEEAIRKFLDEHDDEGTNIRLDTDLAPYNGRGCRWMKREDARHGLVDYDLDPAVTQSLRDATETDTAFGREFARMLNTYWEDIYSGCFYRDYCYSIPNNGYEVKTEESECPTTLGKLLRSASWLPGSDGELHRPAHLFKRNSVTEEADVTHIAERIESVSADLLNTLGVRDDVGITEHQIGIERLVESRKERDADELNREIRSHLHSLATQIKSVSAAERDEVIDHLRECAFIYIPSADPAFRTPSQTTWSGDLGDYVVPIKDEYRGFRDLFVDTFDIEIEPALETYIEFLAQADDDAWSTVEEAWRSIVSQVAHDESIDRELDDIANELAAADALPNVNEELVQYDEIEYIARGPGFAEMLPDTIAAKVVFPWYDARYSRGKAVNRLVEVLDAEPLEEALTREVAYPEYETGGECLYDEFKACLDVGHSVLEAREQGAAADLLASTSSYTVQRPSRVACDYYLNGQRVVSNHEETVFIDEEAEHVLLANEDVAQLDLIDSLAASLDLTGADKNRYTQLSKGAAGKPEGLIEAYLDGEEIQHSSIADEYPDISQSQSSPPTTPDEDGMEEVQTTNRNDGDGSATGVTSIDRQGSEEQPNSLNQTKEPSSTNGQATSSGLSSSSSESHPSTNGGTERTRSAQHRSQKADSNSTQTEREREPSSSDDSTRSKRAHTSNSKTSSGNHRKPSEKGKQRGSHGGWPGGGGGQANKIGDKGEAFAMTHLKGVITDSFDSEPTVDESPSVIELSGKYDDEQCDVTIRDVSKERGRGYDIHVGGADLVWDGDTLAVESIGDGSDAYIEVKATKRQDRQFGMTRHEHQVAQKEHGDYFVVRVINALDDPSVATAFDEIPEVEDAEGERLTVGPSRFIVKF
ncbi:DUF3883 domain-containing protein [Halostella pelagica]|uniref:DUF3883 domain-containing protein n=1 Tax=Halostella pelagica TaxID=2583824 RepID=UPI001080B17D|nr:DUF3883 domain-containing protein [Halostella pelagica]